MNIQTCKHKEPTHAHTPHHHHSNTHTHKHTRKNQHTDKEKHAQLSSIGSHSHTWGCSMGPQAHAQTLRTPVSYCSSSSSHQRRPRVLPGVLQGGHPHQEAGDMVQDLSRVSQGRYCVSAPLSHSYTSDPEWQVGGPWSVQAGHWERGKRYSLLPLSQQLWALGGALLPHTVERGSVSSFIYGEIEAPGWIDIPGDRASKQPYSHPCLSGLGALRGQA